ncbi:MAG: periplasmic protein CpxP/Spy [Paraburkholderia sp.]|jgi:Spy/CpxP family protein refolding chaperone|nr:periplasmic protein CpxP/Spy [Paraburkholderia sp.]MEA3122402.1 periplasmic protein CpxP/Spy [Paraburkholderia sp.]
MKKTLVILACALAANGVFAQTTAAVASSAATSPASKHEARAEERIASLHKQLKITPQEEGQWKPFADAMREDAQTMAQLSEQRMKGVETESALDNMREYARLTQAHADGAKKLVTAFEPLYNSLTPEQKQVADATFRGRLGMHHHHESKSRKSAQ